MTRHDWIAAVQIALMIGNFIFLALTIRYGRETRRLIRANGERTLADFSAEQKRHAGGGKP